MFLTECRLCRPTHCLGKPGPTLALGRSSMFDRFMLATGALLFSTSSAFALPMEPGECERNLYYEVCAGDRTMITVGDSRPPAPTNRPSAPPPRSPSRKVKKPPPVAPELPLISLKKALGDKPPNVTKGPRPVREVEIATNANSCEEFLAENLRKELGSTRYTAVSLQLKEGTLRQAGRVSWWEIGTFYVSIGVSIQVPQRERVPWTTTPTEIERRNWGDFVDRLTAHERRHEAIIDRFNGRQVVVQAGGMNEEAAARNFAWAVHEEMIDLQLKMRKEQSHYHSSVSRSVTLDCSPNGTAPVTPGVSDR
jgi:hypothetical protein